MIGFLQIIIYMLCVYFVLKGIEVYQIGLTNTTDQRRWAMIVGTITVVAALAAAAGFFVFEEYYAQQFAERNNDLQNLLRR
jgi:uncharacterized membrane protein HdeD (DUF308 family)